MTSVAEHYERHLARVYLWMAGGIEHALTVGASDLAAVVDSGGTAVDLGAGFGMHAIPLARAGYEVLAVDTSAHLLDELRIHGDGLTIEIAQCDMLRFAEHLSGKADLIICMGDTLTHLTSTETVAALLKSVADNLAPGGRFVATFRDYSHLPRGTSRFIPVRSDANRIHTCFLEEKPEHVSVHDILHERSDDGWTLSVSSYEKLRLAPQAVAAALLDAGLEPSLSAGPRGMVRVIAAMPLPVAG